MLCPFRRKKGQSLPKNEERFNYLHSLVRGIIEKVFGIIKAKWRWALKGVPMSAEAYIKHFHVACILHNICLEHHEKSSRAAQLAYLHEEALIIADAGSPDPPEEEKNNLINFLARRRPSDAAALRQQYREHLYALRDVDASELLAGAQTQARATDDDGGGRIAADSDSDNEFVVTDSKSGEALRRRTFVAMGMTDWTPTQQESEDATRRAERSRKRSTRRGE
jgi:hypothetical protein